MKIQIKPNSYYKRYYNDYYIIWSTDNKYVYRIARKYNNKPLVKCNKFVNCTIKLLEELLNTYDDHYTILSTDNKYVYRIARKYNNKPLVKCNKFVNYTIDNKYVYRCIIEELSKEDVFLELL